jgi:membrane protein
MAIHIPDEESMQMPKLQGLGFVAVIKKSVKDFFAHDMPTYAAALAYNVLFSLFPFILFLISLLAFLNLSGFFDWLRQQAEAFFPPQAVPQINQILAQLQQRQRGLLSFSVIIALWSASAAIRATMKALNMVYGVEENRPVWKLYLLSFLYTIGIAAMLILAAALLVLGPQAMQWLTQQVGLEQYFVMLWLWLRWPVVLFLLTSAVAVIYYAAPDVQQRFQFITPGAFLAVIVWIAASQAFNYYVRNLANYNAMYGSVGTMIVLLLYLYISTAVLLFGAEINAIIEHHAPDGKQPGEKTLH